MVKKIKLIILQILVQISVTGCAVNDVSKKLTPTVDASTLVECQDWIPIKQGSGEELVVSLRINRINHQTCYEKNKELIGIIKVLVKKD